MKCTSMHGHDPARASARSTGRFLAVLLVALCTLMTVTNDALADVDWKHKGDSSGYVAEVAPYPYTDDGRRGAVAEFLGFDWNSMPQDVKTKILSDGSGTNAFTDLCNNKCKNYVYDISSSSGSDIFSDAVEAVKDLWRTIFGYQNIWRISCTEYQYNKAKELVSKWLFPSDEDEEEETGDYLYPSDTMPTGQIALDNYKNNSEYATIGVEITSVVEQVINSNNASNMKFFATVTNNKYMYIYCVPDDVAVDKSTWKIRPINGETSAIIKKLQFNLTGTFPDLVTVSLRTSGNYNISTTNQYSLSGDWVWPSDGSSGGEPYIPTPDPEPTAPTIQIGDVTIDLSNGPYTINNTTYTAVQDDDYNWTITVTTNTTNNYGGDVQASDPTDYTSILNAILAAINSLRSEMTTYSNQINSSITTSATTLSAAIKSIDTSVSKHIKAMNQQLHSDIQTLQTNMQNSFNQRLNAFATDLWQNMAALDGDIIDELDAVAKYIVEGIDFDSGFSDTNIITWLKKIYTRLAGNTDSVPSVDNDPKGWLDGLEHILDELLDMILSGLNVATLATLFEGLKARFPISIPWDILALVNLFDGTAVTPEFDMPMYLGETRGATVHVDLSEWDDEMALVRQGEMILFGLALMLNTKKLMETTNMVFKRGE